VSQVQDDFEFQLKACGLIYVCEYPAIKDRKYKWDFCVHPDLLIEIQGGTWSEEKSGHSTGAGIRRDCLKLDIAVLHGFRQLNFTSDMVKSGEAIKMVLQAVGREEI
jgi:hypothetical protein